MEIPVNDQTGLRLEAIARETGRSVWELAATAVEEAALNYFRHREDDPAKSSS